MDVATAAATTTTTTTNTFATTTTTTTIFFVPFSISVLFYMSLLYLSPRVPPGGVLDRRKTEHWRDASGTATEKRAGGEPSPAARVFLSAGTGRGREVRGREGRGGAGPGLDLGGEKRRAWRGRDGYGREGKVETEWEGGLEEDVATN